VLCLSASLLEKEQLLFGAGISDGAEPRDEPADAAKLSREALSRASHNLMLQELEGLQKVFCQVRAATSSHRLHTTPCRPRPMKEPDRPLSIPPLQHCTS
jgi:hypothetical protein